MAISGAWNNASFGVSSQRMKMTLYLKYRPQKLSDLDLEEVKTTLEKMTKGGNIPHALLFSGPKGTGKTSAARIVAKILNCERNEEKLKEPCNKCEQCTSIMSGSNVDVVEIDAASHRGIDDIRVIRETVKLAPAKARNKVYIIDEAHMLTLEASNALLKTLEEPPRHVFFILATTDPEKIIPTIRSRTTIINFRKATKKELTDSLEKKAKGEGVKFERKALEAIASFSDGSFRDATKILEQLIDEGVKIDFESVGKYLDKLNNFDLERFIEALSRKDLNYLLESINKVSEAGVEAELLLDKLLLRLRDILISVSKLEEKNDLFEQSDLVRLIELFLEAKRGMLSLSDFEYLPFEIALVKWCSREKEGEEKEEIKKEEKKEVKKEAEDKVKENQKDYKEAGRDSDNISVSQSSSNREINEEIWRQILLRVGKVNTSIEALLHAAKPLGLDGEKLDLAVFYKFHKERLEDGKNRQILETVISQILNRQVKISFSLSSPPTEKRLEGSNSKNMTRNEDLVDVAKNIFSS